MLVEAGVTDPLELEERTRAGLVLVAPRAWGRGRGGPLGRAMGGPGGRALEKARAAAARAGRRFVFHGARDPGYLGGTRLKTCDKPHFRHRTFS